MGTVADQVHSMMVNLTTEAVLLGQVKLRAQIEKLEREVATLDRRLTIRTDALQRAVAILTRRLQPMAAAQTERIIWALDSRLRRLEGRRQDDMARRAMLSIAEASTLPQSVRHARADIVIGIIESHFGLEPGALGLPGRQRRLALARQVAYTLLCRDWGFSTVETGQLLHKDHSTVMYGIRAFDRKIIESPLLVHDVTEIRSLVAAHIQLSLSTDTP